MINRRGLIVLLAALAVVVAFCVVRAPARDLGQWENADPAIRQWYRNLTQPDHPNAPCCAEADAYYADIAETDAKGNLIAVITDDRPDAPLGRPHIDVGTRVAIPNNKIKFDQGNPTGHVVLFLRAFDLFVYCYVQNGGV